MHTNDPENKTLKLKMQGDVTKFVIINPKRVRMNGEAGQEVKSIVSIIPQKKYPFKILETKTLRDGNIRVELEEKKQDQNTEYLLTVVNMKEMKTRYFDTIIVKTDSKIRPEFKISVYGNIADKKTVTKKDK